jgi:hypothetical protein
MADFCAFRDLARLLQSCWQARRRAHQNADTGNETMTYEAKNVRNAFFAITVAFFASAILMAGAVGPAVV